MPLGPIVHWLGYRIFTPVKRVRSSLGLRKASKAVTLLWEQEASIPNRDKDGQEITSKIPATRMINSMVEFLLYTQAVGGSNPSSSTAIVRIVEVPQGEGGSRFYDIPRWCNW